jgi:hypothetical protein
VRNEETWVTFHRDPCWVRRMQGFRVQAGRLVLRARPGLCYGCQGPLKWMSSQHTAYNILKARSTSIVDRLDLGAGGRRRQ